MTSLNRPPVMTRKFVTGFALNALKTSTIPVTDPRPSLNALSNRKSTMWTLGARLALTGSARMLVVPAIGRLTLIVRAQLFPLCSL